MDRTANPHGLEAVREFTHTSFTAADLTTRSGSPYTEADELALLARIATADPDPLGSIRADRMKVLEAENNRLLKRALEIERDKIVAEIGVQSAQDTIEKLSKALTVATYAFLASSIVAVVAVCIATVTLAPR